MVVTVLRDRTRVAALLLFFCVVRPAAPLSAAPFIYATSSTQNAIDVIDAAVSASIGTIPLAIGTADLAAGPDGHTAFALDREADRLTAVDLSDSALHRHYELDNRPSRFLLSRDGTRAFVLGTPSVEIDLRGGAVTPLLGDLVAFDAAVDGVGRRFFAALGDRLNGLAGLAVVDTADRSVLLAAPGFRAEAVAASTDGRLVYAAGTRDQTRGVRLLVLDVASLEPIAELPLSPGDRVFRLLLSDDDATLYALASSSAGVHILSVAADTLASVRTLTTRADVGDMRLSPDGAVLYVSSYQDHAFTALDTASGAVRGRFVMRTPYAAFAVAPDGEALYVAAANGLQVVDAESFARRASVPSVSEPLGIVASRDGGTLFVAGRASRTIGIVDATTQRITDAIDVTASPEELLLSPDGTRLYVLTVGAPSVVQILDLIAARITATLELPGAVQKRPGMALTPDGRRLLVTNHGFASVAIIDTERGEVSASFELRESPSGIAITRDGRLAVVATYWPQHLRFVDLSLTPPQPVGGTTFTSIWAIDPCAVLLRHDGRRAVVMQGDGNGLFAVAVPDGRLVARSALLFGRAAETCGLAFSADETQVYVANTHNHVVSVLDAGTLRSKRHIPTLRHPARLAVACPGGCPPPPPPGARCLADCDADGMVSVSDLVQAVAIATGGIGLDACPAADANDDGRIAISELVTGVANALTGCAGVP